ncbi:MAG: hypothetical protein QNK04_18820 [Myxococcota bacterium]|nr:hypothetical protein [Myxococcota bacterium]
MRRTPRRARFSFALLGALLLHPSAVPAEEGADGRSRVPWPRSLRLLDAATGAGPGDAIDASPRCGAAPRVGDALAFDLLATLEHALTEQQRLLNALRRIAIAAVDPGVGASRRARLETRFAARLERLDAIAEATEVDGLRLLDGGEVCLESVGRVVALPYSSTRDLALHALSVATPADAGAALGALDAALATLRYLLNEARVGVQALEDGPPVGGIREQRRVLKRARRTALASASGTLGAAERIRLDRAFQSDLHRIDEVARNTRLDGLALLDGGPGAALQGSPPRGRFASLDPPDTLRAGLGLFVDVTTDADAVVAILAIDAALERLAAHERELRDLRRLLTRAPRPRPLTSLGR